jgi:hypothetical protein
MGILDQAILRAAKGSAASLVIKSTTAVINNTVTSIGAIFGVKNPFSKLNAQGLANSLSPAPANPPSAEQMNIMTGRVDLDDQSHKVKLYVTNGFAKTYNFGNASTNILNSVDSSQVIFEVQPQVQEHRSAQYEGVNISQMPGQFQKYKGSQSVSWNITAEFVSRNAAEATQNLINLLNLRAWLQPFFGEKQHQEFDGALGAPPPIIWFSGWRGLIGPVPTVMTDLSCTHGSEDCDWIPTNIMAADVDVSDFTYLSGLSMYQPIRKEIDGFKQNGNMVVPFPVVMQVSISLLESFSVAQFNGFDLQAFREGRMVSAWSPSITTQQVVNEVRGS